MSRAHHPAGRANRTDCTYPDCGQAAAAKVTHGTRPFVTQPYVMVFPLGQPNGFATCLDHVHHLVDLMLLRCTPEPEVRR